MNYEDEKYNLHQDDWDSHWRELDKVTQINPAQHYRHQLIFRLVKRFSEVISDTKTIIDFGSGQGDLLFNLYTAVPNVKLIGLELSQSGVNISQNKLPNLEFHKTDLVKNEPIIKELHQAANIAICSEVLEHLDQPLIFLKNMSYYIKSGGLLLVTVPSGPMNEFEKSIGHRKHYRVNEISELIESSGFKVTQTYKAGFPFFNIYKLIALLRGKKLREDAELITHSGRSYGLLQVVLKCFNFLFNFNLDNYKYGWQIIILAEKKID